MRDDKGRWVKGAASPNPGGRPAVLGELREAARGYSQEALEVLASVMRNPEAPPAARDLLDRGFGKAAQSVEMDVKVDMARAHAEVLMELSQKARQAKAQAHMIDVTPSPAIADIKPSK